MVSRTLSVLATLIPAVAFANAVADENSDIQQAELETWSDQQLCRARDIPEALEELERRDMFDGNELRAIRRDEIWEGISEDALRCMKGSPEIVHAAITTVEGDTVDAFVYPQGTLDSLIVYVRRAGDVSTVAAFYTSAELAALNMLPERSARTGALACCSVGISSGASGYAKGNDRRGISRDGQRIYHVSDPSPSIYYPQAP